MRIRFALAGAAALLLSSAAAPAAEKVSWNWSVHGPSRAFTKGIETLAEIVGQKTNGDFTIKVHFGEAISPAKEVLDATKLGAIEGGIACISYAPGKAPLMGVLDLPFLPLSNLDVQQKVHEAAYKYPELEREMQRWDAIAFFSALLPQYEFMGVGKAPKTLDDWKGMRVRALAGLGAAMSKLGAVPTTVPSPEVYTGLERGTFQAVSLPFSYAHATYKLQEVSKWYTYGLAIGTVNCPLVISRTAYEKLPDAYKKILNEAKEPAYEAMKAAYAAADARNIPIFDKAGLERLTYTPEQRAAFEERAAKPVWDEWVKEMEGKGLPGRQVLDFVLAEAKKAARS